MTFKELHEDVDQIFSRLEETSMIWFDDDVAREEFENKALDFIFETVLDKVKDIAKDTIHGMLRGKELLSENEPKRDYRNPSYNAYRPLQDRSLFIFTHKGISRSVAEQIVDNVLDYTEGIGFITIKQVGWYFHHAYVSVRADDEKGWTYDMLKDGGIKIRLNYSTGDYNLIFPKPILKPDRFKEVTENA